MHGNRICEKNKMFENRKMTVWLCMENSICFNLKGKKKSFSMVNKDARNQLFPGKSFKTVKQVFKSNNF